VFGDVAHQICTFHGRRSARVGLPQPRRAIHQPERVWRTWG
jgi:hypothetical protein